MIYDYFDENFTDPRNKLSFEQVRDLALNVAATDSFILGGNPWKFVADDFISAVMNAPDRASHPEREAALEVFEGWDGHFVAGGETQWATGPDKADAWILTDKWIAAVISLTISDELTGHGSNFQQNKNLVFNVILHGLAGDESGIVNNYNWFHNSNATLPQTFQAIAVYALDQSLATLGPPPWGIGKRGTINYKHDLLGSVHKGPFTRGSSYSHCVQFAKKGPVRIESMFPLGESGNILVGAGGTPIFDPNFFSMTPLYDAFVHRPFPLFK